MMHAFLKGIAWRACFQVMRAGKVVGPWMWPKTGAVSEDKSAMLASFNVYPKR